MGSAQSSEATPPPPPKKDPHTPHKLSKPRVGNHATTAGLLGSNGFFSSSSARLSNSHLGGQLPVRPNPAPGSTSASASPPVAGRPDPADAPPNSGSQKASEHRPLLPRKDTFKRPSLFRSKSSQESSERRARRISTGFIPPRRTEKLARANSMIYETSMAQYYTSQVSESWHTPGHRGSTHYDMSSYEAKRLLNLSEEPTVYEHESIRSESKFEVSENTWKSSHPPSGDLSRVNSDLSLYTPVRRRSIIQTPGVATRSKPTPQLATKPSFRHSQPPTPSHQSRQNSMESSSGRIWSLPPRLVEPDTSERAVTPCESHYQQLGGMKFGSLRITNGAPVPSPRSERKANVVDKGNGDDYFSHTSQSRLKIQRKVVNAAQAPTAAVERQKIQANLSPITTTFPTLESGGLLPPPKSSPPKDTAQGYLAEISFSPFSISRSGTPELQTTSKHTALEDDLFEDDTHNELSTREVLDVREDPNAKPPLERPRPDPYQKSLRSGARTDSGFVSSPTSDHSQKPLSKADSGYSSNVSLRSFASKPRVPEKDLPPPPAQSPKRISLDRSSSQASSYLGDIQLPSPTLLIPEGLDLPVAPGREAPPPPLPPKDPPPASPISHDHLVGLPTVVDYQQIAPLKDAAPKKIRRVPLPLTKTPPKDTGPQPQSPISAELSPVGSDASGSAMSIGSGSRRPGKLQRLMSGTIMRGPPSVHPTHQVDKPVPSVPQAVEAKLMEHTGLFPMTTKRLALRTEPSKETLKTIFSVGSVEVTHAEDPQAVAGGQDDHVYDRKLHRRRSLQSMSESIVHAAQAVIPMRHSLHRKPVPSAKAQPATGSEEESPTENIQSEWEAKITSLDCIRNSVGNSAFDQAFVTMAVGRDAYSTPSDRTATMTAQLERDMELRLNVSKAKRVSPLFLDVPSPSHSPFMPEIPSPMKTKTPPPVSMRTRSMRNLRVPPPLRPQSTPVGRKAMSNPPLSRQTSREDIHSYPGAPGPFPHSEDLRSAPLGPRPNPRRSLAAQDHAPRWQDGNLRWRGDGSAHGRASSMSSRNDSSSPQFARPGPPLRHRASYDGYGHPEPSMPLLPHQRQSPNPGTSGHYQYFQQQYGGGGWDQQGRYPPYVPRSRHHRNSSLGSNGRGPNSHHVPYRILHSYNSPAYRHVPIWG